MLLSRKVAAFCSASLLCAGAAFGRYVVPKQDPLLMEQAAGCKLAGEHVVTRVRDGDTPVIVLCGVEEPLRLIGINTPETRGKHQCFGLQASDQAKALLLGKKVRVETDPSQGAPNGRDLHGRLLAYVHLPDNRNFGELMIAEGYAHEETFDRAYRYQADYRAAYARAKAQRKGMWEKAECAEESNKTTVRRRE